MNPLKTSFISISLIAGFFLNKGNCQIVDGYIFKFAPISLLDPVGPNIQLGCEFVNSKRATIETDLAFFLPRRVSGDETNRIGDWFGIKFKPEIRFYPKAGNDQLLNEGLYFANEVYFLLNKYKRSDWFVSIDDNGIEGEPYEAYENVLRREIGDNLKLGIQKTIREKYVIDGYFGMGIKYFNTQKLTNISDPICCPRMRFFDPPGGKGLFPSITMGIKIGFFSNKKKTTHNISYTQ